MKTANKRFITLIAAAALLILSGATARAENDDGGFGAARFANNGAPALSDEETVQDALVATQTPSENDKALDEAADALNAIEAAAGDEPSIIVDQVNPIAE